MSAAYQQGLGELQESDRRTIPYEYAFRFSLTGVPGTTLNSTVTVSIESAYVAVSIGYGVVPDSSPVRFGVPEDAIDRFESDPTFDEITLGDIVNSLATANNEDGIRLGRSLGAETAVNLINGFRLNPRFAQRILLGQGSVPLDKQVLGAIFESVSAPPDQVQFLYSLRDEGTGREFQSEPILNIAGLGIANGDRPFRYFAQPITFAPRSTIRMEIKEVSDFAGELHVALHGYKILGGVGAPTSSARRNVRRMRRR
jgi:hypothetical protein